MSETVAPLARAEVEATARAPESTVAVLCYKQRNQAECVLQQCVGPRGTQSATSASQRRGVQGRILRPEGRGEGGGRGAAGPRGIAVSYISQFNDEGCRGRSSDRRGGDSVGPSGHAVSYISQSTIVGVQRRILRPVGKEQSVGEEGWRVQAAGHAVSYIS